MIMINNWEYVQYLNKHWNNNKEVNKKHREREWNRLLMIKIYFRNF